MKSYWKSKWGRVVTKCHITIENITWMIRIGKESINDEEWPLPVWIRVAVPMMKHNEQSKWQKKGYLTFIPILLKEVTAGIQLEYEPRSNSWSRGHEGVLLTNLLLYFVHPAFLENLSHQLRGGTPTMS